MQVQSLGHVVLKVRSLERSEAFYSGVLGIPVVDRISDPVRMTFFSLSDRHHDFALVEVDNSTGPSDPTGVGLAHVAFEVGKSLEQFDAAKASVEAAGMRVLYEANRSIAKSLHVLDPDGNEVELYVDVRGIESCSQELAFEAAS